MENDTHYHEIYHQLRTGAAAFLRHEQTKDGSIIEGLEIYGKYSEQEADFNTISLIFMAENAATDEKPLRDTMLHAITSIIGSNYQKGQLEFLEKIIRTDKSAQGNHALDLYLRLGAYHEKLRSPIIDFIVEGYTTFSSEQLNLTAFYLHETFPKTQEYFSLFLTILNFHKGIAPDKVEKPMGYLEPEIKPWWKFWK
ncbi:MAG: hypothetical protein RLZZ500_2104 [Bacteroidota bacterium]|jgi:hypothetical protein